MCFYNDDYDWVAAIEDEAERILEKPTRCDECGRKMQVGETAHHVFQQQHEECQACEEGDCDCPDKEDCPHDCKCDEPNFGETFEYDRCVECDKFLKAVEQHETDEQCPPMERQPAYAMMIETISEFERKDALKYFRKAARMFPELKRTGYLKRLWRRMFDLQEA